MKKIMFLLSVILIIVLSEWCLSSSNGTASNLTPKQVVRLYFKYWNEKIGSFLTGMKSKLF